jgi:hypothetical protein
MNMTRMHSKVEKNLRAHQQPRHCEGRRPVAIQCARKGALRPQGRFAPTGLPRAFGPRNDEVGKLAQCFILRADEIFPFLIVPV